MTKPEERWGRLLIVGGTDFATLGRRDKAGKFLTDPERPDLESVHIVRPVANIRFKRVVSSHSSSHAVALTVDNTAYLFGRNDHQQLTYPLPETLTVDTISPEGVATPTPAAPYPFPLSALSTAAVPLALRSQPIVNAAVGRNHTILITESGEAWTAGYNNSGQCGQKDAGEHAACFGRVGGDLLQEEVVEASAGLAFTMFLTKSGKVYAVGSGEKGVLGNGKTGESIHASKVYFHEQHDPLLVGGGLTGKHIVQISSGQYHSVALDDKGFVYAWGWGGLGRLGMGVQVDCFLPTVVPSFAGHNELTRCAKIAAGQASNLFIDNQGMTLLCGRWKTTGDGSSGQPWMIPKFVQDIQGFKMQKIASGGVTLFTATRDKYDGDIVVAWGQGAVHGELGLGPGEVKSATKPKRIEGLDGIELVDMACGQNTTFFIGRPPATPSAIAEAEELKKASAPKVEEAPAPVPAPEPAASAGPPIAGGFDLSGFGFSFGPAKATPPPKAAPAPEPTTDDGLSRTKQDKWEDLGRYPAVHDPSDQCLVCGREEAEEGNDMLECEMCENAWHCKCLSPPLDGPPEGEWFCPNCAIKDEVKQVATTSGKKRPAEEDAQDGERKR